MEGKHEKGICCLQVEGLREEAAGGPKRSVREGEETDFSGYGGTGCIG